MRILSFTTVLLCGFGIGCSACSVRQNPDELREKTAQTTAELKSDATAVAQGVKQGLKQDGTVDINHANKDQLMKLPGMTDTGADRIIASRPYAATSDLVSRRVISGEEYDRIRDHITAQ